jgi:hypothetical protein
VVVLGRRQILEGRRAIRTCELHDDERVLGAADQRHGEQQELASVAAGR